MCAQRSNREQQINGDESVKLSFLFYDQCIVIVVVIKLVWCIHSDRSVDGVHNANGIYPCMYSPSPN